MIKRNNICGLYGRCAVLTLVLFTGLTRTQNPPLVTTHQPRTQPGPVTGTTHQPLTPSSPVTEVQNQETTKQPITSSNPATDTQNPETRLTTAGDNPVPTTDDTLKPTDGTAPTDAQTTKSTDGNLKLTDGTVPTDGPTPRSTDNSPNPTDGVAPTDGPTARPTDSSPKPTDDTRATDTQTPMPTDGSLNPTDDTAPTDRQTPKPTDGSPKPTDDTPTTDIPESRPTDGNPKLSDGPPPTDGPEPRPTDGSPKPTDDTSPTDRPEPSPTDGSPKPSDGPPPTDGPEPRPTDGSPKPTDDTSPTDRPEPRPTDGSPKPSDGPPPTDLPESRPTDGSPKPSDGPPPTDGPEPRPTDGSPKPTDGTPPTDIPESRPTDGSPKPSDGPPPTDGPEPRPTDGSPKPSDGPPPTDIPESRPTDGSPKPSDGPPPTDGPEPRPTDGSPKPSDGPPPTDIPESRPTDGSPKPSDGPPPTDGPEPRPTDGSPKPTDGTPPTDIPESRPTDGSPKPSDGPPPTDGPEPRPTDGSPKPTDGTPPTDIPESRPTDGSPKPSDGPPPTDGPEPRPTDGSPKPTDGTPPTDGPEPRPTDGSPKPTDGTPCTDRPEPRPTDGSPKPTNGTVPTDRPEPGPTDGSPKPTSNKPLPTETPAPKCGSVPDIEFGIIIPRQTDDPTSRLSADVVCDKGYTATKKTVYCLESGEWDAAECLITDCGPLQPPRDGYVDIPEGTTYNAVANYSCADGFSLVGDLKRQCLASGNWNGLKPDCVKDVEKITTCPEDVDTKGRVWAEVLVDKIRVKQCNIGFTGNVTRRCKQNGRWEPPKNNCVRKTVQNVEENVAALGSNATEDEVNDILEDITDVTQPNDTLTEDELLTDGELDVLASSLEKVVDTVLSTNLSSDIIGENITDDVIESASNLIDDANQESWKILTRTDRRGGERVLTAVDSIGDALCPTLQRQGKQKKTIVKRNVAFEVQKVSDNDVLFPNADEIQETADGEWLRTGKSKILLRSVSLKGKSNPCSITIVMYRNLSDVLPTQTSASNESYDEESQSIERINAPILAMTISPPVSGKIDPPVRITFEHADSSLADPICAFWQFQNDTQGFWSSEGCSLYFTNENYTICECDHLTNFAILMSPFSEADASSQALRIISIIGISVSIICLLITCGVHLFLWRQLRHDRTTRLMNLCVSLLLSYIIFLAGADRTESSFACAVIAAVLQYIYLVVFCVMLVEGVEIAVTLLVVFKTKSRTKLLLILAWVVPAVIVAISLGVTKLNGYGNENFCWLSVSNGVIWAFVGPALVIIFFNVICLFIVIRAMFRSTAVKSKKTTEKIRTSLWSLCVLVPITGLSWTLGIFYVDDSFYFIQYIFAILNGLQGFFIFLFHCLLNKQVKNAYKLHARKKSATYFSTTPTSKDERNMKSKEKHSSYEDAKSRDTGNGRKNKILQESFPQSQVQYGSSLGMYNKGSMRKSAPFSSESRDKLISNSSTSY